MRNNDSAGEQRRSRAGWRLGWAAIVVIFALLPEKVSPGPLGPLARYVLIAYAPGYVLWSRLRSPASGLLDRILFPSLLSLMPVAWAAMAATALGLDLAWAAWTVAALFAAAGFAQGWNGGGCATPGEKAVLSAVAIGVLLLVGIPFAVNAFSATAWDAPKHAAVASRILEGHFPPDSPFVAGQSVNYYWLYHFHTALLSEFTRLGLYQVFALVSLHALLLFALAGYRLTGRLTESAVGRMAGTWLLVFGLNPFGWMFFLNVAPQNPNPWFSLLVPIEMVRGYPMQLSSLIHQFLDGSPFPISFAFEVIWLDSVLGRLQGERGRGSFATGSLALASALYLHLMSASILIAASLAALAWIVLAARDVPWSARRDQARQVLGMIGAASIVAAPYAWQIFSGRTGNVARLDLGFASMSAHAWGVLLSQGLVAALALPALRRAWRGESASAGFLAALVGVLIAGALVLEIEGGVQYKLVYLMGLALSPLAAASWEAWRGTPSGRLGFLLILLLCTPTNLVTSYAFVIEPPREEREDERMRMMQWIREETPPESVFVESPYWIDEESTLIEYLSLDRYWLDAAVYGRRRLLGGYTDLVLRQWSYRDVDLRRELSRKLAQGLPLSRADRDHLAELDAPIYVAPRADATPHHFDPGTYRPVYEDGGVRIFRVFWAEKAMTRPPAGARS
jgi:hypothetical protein